MNIKEQIKLLLQEADLYRSQSLLNESIGKYKKAVELIQKNVQIKNKQNLIDVITKKIRAVENDLDKTRLIRHRRLKSLQKFRILL